ncbi:MAG: acyl-CoA dehydrogenase family protein [Pelistega sp.]|nr:acyl-CoA dehydrogenase family protein [Pelistega sp.]
MDFKYSEEQQMLSESLRRMAKDVWSFEQRRQRQKSAELDGTTWQHLAELGVLGLTIPQEFDGFGEGPASLLAIHLELGRALVAEPVIASSVHSSAILRASSQAQAHELLRHLAAGESVCTVALGESSRVDNLGKIQTLAQAQVDSYVLSGTKHNVAWGAQADYFIVSALLEGQLAVFLVPSDVEGVSKQDFPTMDGMRCASVSLNQLVLAKDSLLLQGQRALEVLQQAEQEAIAAVCAQTVGMMEQLLAITIEYLKTRQQFGKALASFQVIQHRLADMYIQIEVAKSMAFVAAQALGLADAKERQRRISAAKIKVMQGAKFIGESAVQLHGGMGMTDELEVGDYFKRMTLNEFHYGDSVYHLSQLAILK